MGIRKAGPRDRDKVEKLLRDCGQPCDGSLFGDAGLVLLAERQGKTVGVLGLKCRGRNAVLLALAVAPPQRGRGVGRALVAQAEREATGRGAGALYVLCMTAARYFAVQGYLPCPLDKAPVSLLRVMENAHPPHPGAACLVKKLAQPRYRPAGPLFGDVHAGM